MARFAEFFAGIGLVRMALEPLGWDCAFANDISPDKARMYADMFGPQHLVEADIKRISFDQLPVDLDLVTASFPCVDLSLAGNRRGLDGQHSGVFWPFLHLLRDYSHQVGRPKGVLLENVVGLLSLDGGAHLERVIEALNELGYGVDLVVIDAKWFVPQSRPRVFVIGLPTGDNRMLASNLPMVSDVRPEMVRRFQRNHPQLRFGEILLPDPPKKPGTKLAEILEDIPSDSRLWWPEDKVRGLVSNMSDTNKIKAAALAAGAGEGVGTIYRRVRNGRAVGELRSDGIAGCLRTPVGGSSVQFLFDARGGQMRIRAMTSREYARLQGAGEFPIGVGERQAMYGFGDAVCVPAVRWLAKYAFGHLADSDVIEVENILPAAQARLLERRARFKTRVVR